MELASYKVYPKQNKEFARVINTYSRGKAKSEYLTSLQECWDGYNYTDLRCNKVGEPQTSEGFKSNAEYRNIPFAYCGMKVQLHDDSFGFICGHTSTANLYVLVFTGKKKGNVVPVHPNSKIKYFDKSGDLIIQF